MENLTIRRIATVLAAAMLLWTSASRAQLDEGHTSPVSLGDWGHKPVGIFQYGQLVGQVWVAGTADPCQYTEHWYLSPAYVYPNSPGEGEIIETTIRALEDAPAFATWDEWKVYAAAIMPGGKRILVPVLELERCGPGQGLEW